MESSLQFAEVDQIETPIQRVFLDWERAALPAACDWFISQWGTERTLGKGRTLDLSQLLVVLPTARARRRLLQLMSFACNERQFAFNPPEVITAGTLPEFLYDNARPFADEATRLLSWIAAFRELPIGEQQWFLPDLAPSDLRRPMEFAEQLKSLHAALAAEVKSFSSVARHVEAHPDLGDQRRWTVLSKVQATYYERLTQLGLWDQQAARNVAIKQHLCRTDRWIVLVGTADLNEAVKAMLNQVAKQVTALVFAPPEKHETFDSMGCLLPAKWTAAEIRIPDDKIRIVDRARDQATEVLDFLRELDGEFSGDQITIGVPDDNIAAQLELAFRHAAIPHRRLEGKSLASSPPVRLLVRVAEFLTHRDYGNFMELTRHADFFAWMSRRLANEMWLAAVDDYQAEFLPTEIQLESPRETLVDRLQPEVVTHVHSEVMRLVRPFYDKSDSTAVHALHWRDLLDEIYFGIDDGKENPADEFADSETVGVGIAAESRGLEPFTLAAISSLHAAFESIENAEKQSQAMVSQAIKRELPTTNPVAKTVQAPFSARQTLDLALGLIANEITATVPDPTAIELAGWLDLPLDDAPVMVVTGLNEGIIPSDDVGSPLMPLPLAQSLGIFENERRLARDAYALGMITASRSRCKLITGRHDGEGNPLLISRLLLAADDESLVRRTNAFFSFPGQVARRRWLMDPRKLPAEQQFKVPRPLPVPPIQSLSVTRFRDYIKCPYRFYLTAVMRLETAMGYMQELDGSAFGNLAHDVLQAFGNDASRESEIAGQIYQFFCDQLDQRAASRGRSFAAVRVQYESLRFRLRHFADAQAKHRANGWRIVAVENDAEYTFDVDALPFTIKGRIDRIDRHENGQFAVWDYKTSDAGLKVQPAHRKRTGDWIDLQLPLYRYLLASLFPDALAQLNTIQMGYVLLPKSTSQIEFNAAEWQPAELIEADEFARRIIRSIRNQEFWPPSEDPPDYCEHYAAICQDNVVDREVFLR